MSKLSKSNQSGFTIIEVVLALAIGAMIIGMVFIALPNLQKQRRDTARRNDLGRFLGQLEAYAGNNNGQYPDSDAKINDTSTGFLAKYVKKDAVFEDPSKGAYIVEFSDSSTATSNEGKVGYISYHLNSKCEGEVAATNTGSRNIAVVFGLERGSACQANQ